MAEADPVTGFAGLIKQRRRWLNGTFFAMIYTLSNWSRIWTESHHRWGAGQSEPGGRQAGMSAAACSTQTTTCKPHTPPSA